MIRRRRTALALVLCLLGAGTACQSYRMVNDPTMVGADGGLRADFSAPRAVVIVGPGVRDSLRAGDVTRLEGRLQSVSGDTIRVLLDAAYNAAGHRYRTPRGSQVTLLRGDAIYSAQRGDSGRTAGLVVGGVVVVATLAFVAVTILIAAAFSSLE